MADTAINPGNWQMVRVHGDDIVILRPASRLTRDHALLHAAWLVTMAEMLPGDLTFEEALRAVRNT